MNIFFLDRDPQKAAQYHADVHVGKMLLESCQLLSNAYYHWVETVHPKRFKPIHREKAIEELWDRLMTDYPRDTFYKRTHYNVPCSRWVRASQKNFEWLMFLAYFLASEWKKRCEAGVKGFKEPTRKEVELVQWMVANPPNLVQRKLLTLPCPHDDVKEYWKKTNPIKAYRMYYFLHKSNIIFSDRYEGWYGSHANAPTWYHKIEDNFLPF